MAFPNRAGRSGTDRQATRWPVALPTQLTRLPRSELALKRRLVARWLPASEPRLASPWVPASAPALGAAWVLALALALALAKGSAMDGASLPSCSTPMPRNRPPSQASSRRPPSPAPPRAPPTAVAPPCLPAASRPSPADRIPSVADFEQSVTSNPPPTINGSAQTTDRRRDRRQFRDR